MQLKKHTRVLISLGVISTHSALRGLDETFMLATYIKPPEVKFRQPRVVTMLDEIADPPNMDAIWLD